MNSNEDNELTPFITQPSATTRRGFIKRTASAAMVATLALGAFKNEAHAAIVGSVSTTYTLALTDHGTPMRFKTAEGQILDSNTTLVTPNASLLTLEPEPLAAFPENLNVVFDEEIASGLASGLVDDSDARGWIWSCTKKTQEQAECIRINPQVPDDPSYYRWTRAIIIQSRPLNSYTQIQHKALGKGFLQDSFEFAWEIKVTILSYQRAFIYKYDAVENEWVLESSNAGPDTIAEATRPGHEAWNEKNFTVFRGNKHNAGGTVSVDTSSGVVVKNPGDPADVFQPDGLAQPVVGPDKGLYIRTKKINYADHFRFKVELISAGVTAGFGNPLLPDAPVWLSLEIDDLFDCIPVHWDEFYQQ